MIELSDDEGKDILAMIILACSEYGKSCTRTSTWSCHPINDTDGDMDECSLRKLKFKLMDYFGFETNEDVVG